MKNLWFGLLLIRYSNEWIVEGNWLDPNMDFELHANRWEWLGYPFWGEIPIIVALSEITDHVIIVQNDDGGIWIPRQHLNTIGMMETGEGYFVFLNNDVTFRYHEDGVKTTTDNEVLDIPEVVDAPTPTGMPYAVLVHISDELSALNPATVELYDGMQKVGKAVVLSDRYFTPVTAWQGSAEYDLPGFTPGNPITVKVFSTDGELLVSTVPRDLADSNSGQKARAAEPARFGVGAYAEITLDGSLLSDRSAIVPTEFSVGNAYPNPFNPTLTVPFSVPESGADSPKLGCFFSIPGMFESGIVNPSGNNNRWIWRNPIKKFGTDYESFAFLG